MQISNFRSPTLALFYAIVVMTSLRSQQSKVYFADPTKEATFRREFGLPDLESPLSEVHAVLSLQGKEEAFSGKLYLSSTFLAFASLDKRSCRLSLPLATIRRVEKVAPPDGIGLGAFALSLTLLHGARIVLQLNSLKPTNDNFCAILRTRLKACLPKMKSLQPFAETFFSEYFLLTTSTEKEMKTLGPFPRGLGMIEGSGLTQMLPF